MAQKLDRFIFTLIALCFAVIGISQEENTTPVKTTNYKSDSSFIDFNQLRFSVAKAQINLLKKEGALLVRLKTNANTINKLKASGSIDLATQVERETYLKNKIIVRSFTNEFKFCPVYFFYSDCSDSVKHKKLDNIFVDTNLVVDPTIVCNASFYLIAEQGTIYESSLGIVSEADAPTASERGAASKEVAIVVKNRYFIQLQKPFPYYQAGYSMKKYKEFVKKFNSQLQDFYSKNISNITPPEVKEYVY